MSRRPGFHRSDFLGTSGPGMERLRASPPKAEELKPRKGKAAGLLALSLAMSEGRWQDAILLASKWSDLGDHAAAIHRGREAILRPKFQLQLKRDPEQMIAEAKEALLERYSK